MYLYSLSLLLIRSKMGKQEKKYKVGVIDDEIGVPSSSWNALFVRDYSFQDIEYLFYDARDQGEFCLEAVDSFVASNADLDVILLDWNFGASSGFGLDILKRLKENKVDVPIAMITSESGNSAVREACSCYGVGDYIPKDVTPRDKFYLKLTKLAQRTERR